MAKIYLISEDGLGAAYTNDEKMARTLEAVAGYRRCTRAEYRVAIQKQRQKDTEKATAMVEQMWRECQELT